MSADEKNFYVLDGYRIPGFADILEKSAKLSRIPEDYAPSYFQDQLGDTAYGRGRQEIYHLPDRVSMLKREAEEHLQTRLPNLRKKLFHKENNRSRHRPGIKINKGNFAIIRDPLLEDLEKAVEHFFGTKCLIVGNYWYPKGGYRSWHTNKYDPHGWAMFLVDVDRPGASWFQYLDPVSEEWIKIPDRPGMVTVFRIDPDELLWHSVVSEDCNRWSQGFIIPDNWKDRLL